MSEVLAAIDKALQAITARMKAKGEMYLPDEEWCRLRRCAAALREAKRELERGGK
jgi:hypothetical protein